MGKRTNTFRQRVVQHGPGPLNGTFSSTQGGRTYYCFTENDPAIVLSQRGTVLELSEDEDDSDEDFGLAHPARTTTTAHRGSSTVPRAHSGPVHRACDGSSSNSGSGSSFDPCPSPAAVRRCAHSGSGSSLGRRSSPAS
ncbi:hypothetical protein CF336_g9496, partial [Tilletia laevis]